MSVIKHQLVLVNRHLYVNACITSSLNKTVSDIMCDALCVKVHRLLDADSEIWDDMDDVLYYDFCSKQWGDREW